MIAATPLAVLQQAQAWLDQGEPVALVTLVGIEGSSSRALGSQMAVSASGASIGSFSGGCIDGAIVGEAQRALSCGSGATVRFGAGSPYIDVRLPCGGGIDLLFTPNPASEVLREAICGLHRREAVEIKVNGAGIGLEGAGFALSLHPRLRVIAFGQGEDLAAFARLSARFGTDLAAHTPDPAQADLLRAEGLAVQHLGQLGHAPDLTGDAWTAFVFLFHDHDWEIALLPKVLQQPGLFHGAIGSTRTHAARLENLRRIGVPDTALARLRGHIGLIPATRDPATLAVSILAEVAACHARACTVPIRELAAVD